MHGTDLTFTHETAAPKDPPIVSIGLPVFNGERYLERAARSILDQDFRALELIIVDNASDDATAAIAERLVAADSRVRFYRNPRNLGASRNFCRAFELARGRYFKWAAYDDWLEPTFLSACLEVLEREPQTVLVFPGTNVYDESGDLLRRYRHPAGLTSSSPAKRFFNSLWNWKYATAVFGMMRTEALKETHLIQPYVGSDRLLFSELVLLGDIRELSEHLFNSTETVSVRRGRGRAWWAEELEARPTFDRWRLLGDYLALVARTPRFGFAQRVQMTGAVLGFFCRRWPRRELFDELRTGATYTWQQNLRRLRRAAARDEVRRK
jgi:glycosyltransferase involved in cell wall biosynthesis